MRRAAVRALDTRGHGAASAKLKADFPAARMTAFSPAYDGTTRQISFITVKSIENMALLGKNITGMGI